MTHYKAPVLQICTCIWGSNLHLMQANLVLHMFCSAVGTCAWPNIKKRATSSPPVTMRSRSPQKHWSLNQAPLLGEDCVSLPNPENVQEAQFCRWLATEFFVWIWEFIWQSEMMKSTCWSYIMILFCVNVHLILLDLTFKSRNSRCRI
jgi:hypothetical protein